MRLTVLADNNTFIDRYYQGEPALCFYIEDEGTKLLFDTGYSDLFIKNAEAMGIDISQLSAVVLSHGHNDHTRGLDFLKERIRPHTVKLVAHPDTFKERTEGELSIGSPLSQSELEKVFNLQLSRTPVAVSEHITFLGEIPPFFDFEKRKSIGVITGETCLCQDLVMDDSALVYKNKDGLFIITGCSHSGICTIIEYAKEVHREDRITGVIGGFHLLQVSEQLEETIRYFKKNRIENLYPCHCVSFAAKAAMHREIPVQEVGVGLMIEI